MKEKKHLHTAVALIYKNTKLVNTKNWNISFNVRISMPCQPPGYDDKDCPGQVTYLVRQVKISVACPTRQGVIIFFNWQYHISIQALDFESLWQFLFCGSTITTSVSFPSMRLACQCSWANQKLALFTRGEAWLALSQLWCDLFKRSIGGRIAGGGGEREKWKQK